MADIFLGVINVNINFQNDPNEEQHFNLLAVSDWLNEQNQAAPDWWVQAQSQFRFMASRQCHNNKGFLVAE